MNFIVKTTVSSLTVRLVRLVHKLCVASNSKDFFAFPEVPKIKTKGAALLLFVVFFVIASLVLILSTGRGVYDDLVAYRELELGKKSFYGAEAGIEDALKRHMQGDSYSSSETFTIAGVTITTNRTMVIDTYEIVAEGNATGAVRRSEIVLVVGDGASFNFGLQSHTGGITLANSAAVHGNVYSNGSITGAGNMVYGDVVSAGPAGLIDDVHATGSAYAHTINDAHIEKDAYYQTITATIVGGNSYPGSPDQATATLPIEDSQFDDWKTDAEAGGTLPLTSCSGGTPAGTYEIDSDQVIGPIKIPCNLLISKNGTDLSVAGPVWVVGNISTVNGPVIQVSSTTISGRSSVLIADNPSNRTTSSKISIQGSTGFLGTTGDSYMLLVSLNESSASGGSEIAINIDNNTPSGQQEVIYYAPYGKLAGSNSLELRGATAHLISLSQSASVFYETGMISLLFSGGSGGSFYIDSWREIE